MPMSSSAFAPVTTWSSPISSTFFSHSRRSVGVFVSVRIVVAMACLPLALFVVECTRQRARSPPVVGDRGAVLDRELDPDLLVAAELRRRMRAGPHQQIADLHHAVEAIAQERGDAQRARELVRHTGRLRADDDVLRS